MPRGLSRPPLPQHLTANKDRSLSGIVAEVITNTVFTAYKSSVFKHVVLGARTMIKLLAVDLYR